MFAGSTASCTGTAPEILDWYMTVAKQAKPGVAA